MLRKIIFIFSFSLCFAEESSLFFGVDALNLRADETVYSANSSHKNRDLNGHRMGILVGYKHFFSENFALRLYGNFNYGAMSGKDSVSKNSIFVKNMNFLTHIDALYILCNCNDNNVGVYSGINFGYASYDVKNQGFVNGFDSGLNFGVRVAFSGGHSIELYRRFALAISDYTYKFQKIKIHQVDNTGIRYLLHFWLKA